SISAKRHRSPANFTFGLISDSDGLGPDAYLAGSVRWWIGTQIRKAAINIFPFAPDVRVEAGRQTGLKLFRRQTLDGPSAIGIVALSIALPPRFPAGVSVPIVRAEIVTSRGVADKPAACASAF